MKTEHLLELIDGINTSSPVIHKNHVSCEPNMRARARIVFVASMEHEFAYLFDLSGACVASCGACELPGGAAL